MYNIYQFSYIYNINIMKTYKNPYFRPYKRESHYSLHDYGGVKNDNCTV